MPSASVSQPRTSRLLGVSAGRFLAVAGVILIHSAHDISFTLLGLPDLPIIGGDYAITIGSVIKQFGRFAVPFFFIASGYFAMRRQNDNFSAIVSRMAKRVLIPFLIFSALYNLTSPDRLHWFTGPKFILRWLLNGGAGYHLWFLPSLFLWLPLALLLKRWLSWRWMGTLAALLYIAGLLGAAYQPLILHSPHPLLARLSRDGPEFGFPMVVIGMWLQAARIRLPGWQAFLLCFAGFALQSLEGYWLNQHRITPFDRPDYLLGTIAFGAGAFLLALQWPADNWLGRRLAALGDHAFGIYAVHLWFLQLLAWKLQPLTLPAKLEVAAATLILATLTTLAAASAGKIFVCSSTLSRQGQ